MVAVLVTTYISLKIPNNQTTSSQKTVVPVDFK